MKVELLIPLRNAGKRYEIGEKLQVSEEEGQRLIEAKVAKKIKLGTIVDTIEEKKLDQRGRVIKEAPKSPVNKKQDKA